MQITYRQALIQDSMPLARIYRRALGESFRQAGVSHPVPSEKDAQSSILCDNIIADAMERTILIASIDDQPVGFVSFGSKLELLRGDVTGEVFMLYVDPASWRLGIGAKLVRRATEELKRRGHDRVLLWIVDGAEGALKFYESEGWQTTELRREDFEGAPIRRQCLTKVL